MMAGVLFYCSVGRPLCGGQSNYFNRQLRVVVKRLGRVSEAEEAKHVENRRQAPFFRGAKQNREIVERRRAAPGEGTCRQAPRSSRKGAPSVHVMTPSRASSGASTASYF